MKTLLPWTLFLAAAIAFPAPALPDERKDRDHDRDAVSVSGERADAVFGAGREVRIEAKVADDVVAAAGIVSIVNSTLQDLIAAGGRITATASAAQDLVLAGGSVELGQISGDDLFAAGGTVEIAADLRDDLVAAGGRVRTLPATRVGGTAWIAGGDVIVAGTFAGNLHLAGGAVRLDGAVAGDVDIRAGSIALGPSARVGGKLRYAADDPPEMPVGAVVTGGVERLPRGMRGPDIDLDDVVWGVVWFMLAAAAGLAIVVLVVQAAVPTVLSRAQARLAEHPWESLGIGVAAAIVMPLVAMLLAATVVGLPLALLIGLVYLVLGLIALAVLAYRIGVWGRIRFTSAMAEPGGWLARLAWTLAGLIAAAVVFVIPFVGWAIVWLALAAAFGALLVESRGMLRQTPA